MPEAHTLPVDFGFHAGYGLLRVLYMAAVVAVRFEPRIKAFYQHLFGRGKSYKVAINACMHKLLTILNAMMRDKLAAA